MTGFEPVLFADIVAFRWDAERVVDAQARADEVCACVLVAHWLGIYILCLLRPLRVGA